MAERRLTESVPPKNTRMTLQGDQPQPCVAVPFDYNNKPISDDGQPNTADFRTSFEMMEANSPIPNFNQVSQKLITQDQPQFKGPQILDRDDHGMMQKLDGNRISETISDDMLDTDARMSDMSNLTIGN